MTSAVMWLWSARVVWASLPVAAGGALADAVGTWSRGPAIVAACLLWAAWTVGLLALLAPRPWGLTALRVVAPAGVAVAAATIESASGASTAVAVASCGVAAALALSAPVAEASGNALAYGDEERFVLRIPAPLLLAPVPLAVAAVVAGIAAGPLLLAAGDLVIGGAALVVGLPLAALLARSLHQLARRWVVLVPAGLVVVDPLTLVDPVLVRREQVEAVRAVGAAPVSADVADLRLGSAAGTVAIVLREPVPLARRAGRRGAELRPARVVVVAPVRTAALLAAAGTRRIAVDRRG